MPLFYPRCIKVGGDLNSFSVSEWRHRKEFSIDEQLLIGIYLEFCLSYYTLRNIKKWSSPKIRAIYSGVPSPEGVDESNN